MVKSTQTAEPLVLGMPTNKKTPPAKVVRKRVEHTGRQKQRADYEVG